MRRALVLLATCSFFLGACSSTPSPRSTFSPAPTQPTSSGVPTPSPEPDGDRPPAIRLPHLPQQGIAIEGGREHSLVALLNLHGEVLARLARFQLANPFDRPGVVLLRRGRQTYVLRVEASMLEPVSASRARGMSHRFDHQLDLPELQGTVDDARSQDWRWMDLAPNGNALLAQWFGHIGSECEMSIAYLVPVQEGAAAPVTGPAAPKRIPASLALGWTGSDRAVVLLRGGFCGSPRVGSGVWSFSSPGRGKRISARIPGAYQFRMWGSSAAPTQP